MVNELSERQTLFVEEYLVDLDARRAAVAAGYSSGHQGYAQLHSEKVVEKIKERMKGRVDRLNARLKGLEISQDRILIELARIAFFDPRDLFKEDGSVKEIHELSHDVAAAVNSIKVKEITDVVNKGKGKAKKVKVVSGFIKQIKPWDKIKAIELAARHLGMLNDKLNIDKKVSHKIEVESLKDKYKGMNKDDLESIASILTETAEREREGSTADVGSRGESEKLH